MSLFYPIFFGIIFYIVLFFLATALSGDLAFNLKANYERWNALNWFGVWVLTILYWIAFLPFTIIALICWIFTVGRK
jgi:hypothetical protein